ncbi:butyrophilin subfamily 1 member A1 [Talpa occidentalis]|uniref:butyrophilin subfamily 1 member A1 n=1 Tax=Talpa occidentalis TaxID=50954 RepID=UPI00188DE163|nr:butyrophilin subfamily 1 member A1 [Talpa occidentalis]
MARTHGLGAPPPSRWVPLVLQLLSSCSPGNGKADFQVSGPSEPILATVGSTGDLPCRLTPNISARDMALCWYRDQPSAAVHVWDRGRDAPEAQMGHYRGRTSLLGAHLAQGRATVRIHNVSAFDNGTFHCRFTDGTASAGTTLWLRVAGLGSEPRIHAPVHGDRGVRAECTSTGWFPEPQVEWTDLQGQALPSVTNLSASPETGLFAVVSSVALGGRALKGVACSISSPLLQQRKVAELRLHASSSRRATLGWRTALPLLAAAGITVAGTLCLFWTRQREEKQQQLEEVKACGPREQPASGPGDAPIPESLSLDPDTASPKLALSADGRSVARLLLERELPDGPGRFDRDPCVLGRARLWAGQHCWEVEVGNRSAWTLGVCLESLQRKGRVPKSPHHGVWAVELHRRALWALTFPRVRLRPRGPLQRVRVLLDLKAREVAFHSGDDGSLLHTFSGLSFSGALRPFFCLWTHDPRPLTICPGPQGPEASEPPQGQGQERDAGPPPGPRLPPPSPAHCNRSAS